MTAEMRGETFRETRYLGVEQCPNGPHVHVAPMVITSSARLINLETPGNIMGAEFCPACHPRDRSEESSTS